MYLGEFLTPTVLILTSVNCSIPTKKYKTEHSLFKKKPKQNYKLILITKQRLYPGYLLYLNYEFTLSPLKLLWFFFLSSGGEFKEK